MGVATVPTLYCAKTGWIAFMKTRATQATKAVSEAPESTPRFLAGSRPKQVLALFLSAPIQIPCASGRSCAVEPPVVLPPCSVCPCRGYDMGVWKKSNVLRSWNFLGLRYCPRDARPNRSTLDLSRPYEVDAGIRVCRQRRSLLCAHRFSADSVEVDAQVFATCQKITNM